MGREQYRRMPRRLAEATLWLVFVMILFIFFSGMKSRSDALRMFAEEYSKQRVEVEASLQSRLADASKLSAEAVTYEQWAESDESRGDLDDAAINRTQAESLRKQAELATRDAASIRELAGKIGSKEFRHRDAARKPWLPDPRLEP
jgi:hypothetical protein